ncbi:MAG: nuclear transport factor 2 family protein [Acidimicrobiales bacterium]
MAGSLDETERARQAVGALVQSYADRLDAGNLDGVAELFARATWRSAGRTEALRGRDEVRAAYDRVLLYDGVPRTHHVISDLEVDVDAIQGTATSRCCFTVLQWWPGEPRRPVLAGRYEDIFARTAGEWHFTDRLIHPDLVGDLSRHHP